MDIGQFLLSYWWIIVLLVAVIAIITRSLIKLMVSIVVVAVLFALFWQIFVAPGFSKSTKCFTDEAEEQALITDRAQSMSPGGKRNLFICKEAVLSFERLTQCLKKSQRDNKLSFFIYLRLPYFKRTISETVTSHNKLCPESLLTVPSF